MKVTDKRFPYVKQELMFNEFEKAGDTLISSLNMIRRLTNTPKLQLNDFLNVKHKVFSS